MGDYTDFADCVSKNKSKDDPKAYCGYIKNQIEGGKKKEECLEATEHEAYHLEEEVKKLESLATCPNCGSSVAPSPEAPGPGGFYTCDKCGKLYKKTEETDRQTRLPKGVRHTVERMGGEDWTPESEIEKAKAEFLNTLKATIDEMTLMAKDVGYSNVSEKTSPTPSTYMYEVKQPMADVFVKQAKGFGVEVNWFNTTMDELQDIVKSANKFFTDAGWNSKETVKEYEKHAKKWGKDFT
jgi:predicted RNA-binding Zn-ribbon protein involved in translation (DUF1610 family)